MIGYERVFSLENSANKVNQMLLDTMKKKAREEEQREAEEGKTSSEAQYQDQPILLYPRP